MRYRNESDSMGEVRLPEDSWYGAQTQRAVGNFGISSLHLPLSFIKALALVKKSAAISNQKIGELDENIALAISNAATEVIDGKLDDQFPVDVFQTGSGTSTNMNMNEVLANRANVALGGQKGTRKPIHPNDHVNKAQSSNDVIPTALNIANRLAVKEFIENLEVLESSLAVKEKEFARIIKLGRTHLQDAVPMTLGQEFGAFREQIHKGIKRLAAASPHLEELALGGTAVGSGLNCPAGFAEEAISCIVKETGIPFITAKSRFEAIACRDAQVELMGAVNTVAISLGKIADDLRLLSSGPRSGLGEITIPPLQPGSSIMPGKVNPVIPEMVIQAAAFARGQALTVSIGGTNGPLQLNMMHPVIAWSSLSAMEVLGAAAKALGERCIDGIKANINRAAEWVEQSLALVTPLALEIGYDKAAELAHQAYESGKTIRETVKNAAIFPDEEIDRLLNPNSMIQTEEK
ncbi:Fumarate hydratase class II [Olavius algarvensis spirochete endosymbiont]|uniref:class II fumarate hydratase n=1 Tax=Olavius algarvensis spirochete endosymbiont TaxID=260710 RepID=UPI00052E1291|nr:class II fumarate hydratase [Olavius algarvensis spirochete endosymbiont]KGM43967.1 aspartate ammonia-lyase [Alkalispirochaeta odontotermitis]CAD7837279.1 MAG: Fumarate hydratase class II (EC 4.2.1.2) [Olavius algarvensis spirochete endosymbiont]VDB00728.1 Fumarate hydratase class II [Olavius algarvensis spirochete endosymbiont]